jgi:acyl-CoA reductase-like NAD-dependent aldehyde dehydrogenase
MHSFHPDQIQVSSSHYIGGRHVAGRGPELDVRRPSDNAVYAGLPVGDADLVDEAVQNALVRHPRIAKVTFTGSTRTGCAIMAACAQTGTKPVTLELGGKSPQLVFADASDLDKVARMVAGAIAGNAGQVCVAGTRLIVQRQVADPMEAVHDEIFGPVLTAQVFDDEDEALALGDHPSYGLAAGVHTSDVGRALRCARGLEAGTVWINRYGRSDDFVLPTGGFKRSGMGKDLGRQSYEANLRFKTVRVDFAR